MRLSKDAENLWIIQSVCPMWAHNTQRSRKWSKFLQQKEVTKEVTVKSITITMLLPFYQLTFLSDSSLRSQEFQNSRPYYACVLKIRTPEGEILASFFIIFISIMQNVPYLLHYPAFDYAYWPIFVCKLLESTKYYNVVSEFSPNDLYL